MTVPLEAAPVDIGPHIAGEIIVPLTFTYRDADGDPIVLTGYTVRVSYRVNRGTQVLRNGALGTGPGEVVYTWVAADLTTAGLMEGEIIAGNGLNRLAQRFRLPILAPLGGTLPAI